jgi:hypothetical protein
LQRIFDVQHARVLRWPWLTDEGWTWKWILGAVLIGLLIAALLALAGWCIYRYVALPIREKWGEKTDSK